MKKMKKKTGKTKAGTGRTPARGVAARSAKPLAKTLRTAKRARPGPRKKTAVPAMTQEAMMAAWQKAMSPGAGHARLEPMVGTWAARTTFTMGPDAPPQVSQAVSEHRWVLGGRYLEQSYRGASMGMLFEGLGYTGYDNIQGKYVGTWMDTFGTGFMNSVGVGKPSGTQIDFEAHSIEPSGKRIRFECRVLIQDRDHHSYEMWTRSPDGRRYRVMLGEYTRR